MKFLRHHPTRGGFAAKNQYLIGSGLAIAIAAMAGMTAAPAHAMEGDDRRLNVLIVFCDDLDTAPLGFMGNDIVRTPNIDTLAAEGLNFTNAFVTTSICITSRGNMLTGRYASRTDIWFDGFEDLTPEQQTMSYSTRLREAGYHTGYVGKWHLGPAAEHLFDDNRAFLGQGFFWDEEHPPGEGRHLTDRIGDDAADMIRVAPREKPFVITVGFKAPHVQDGFHPIEPYPPTPSTAVLYELDEMPAPPLSDAEFFENQPDFIRESLGRVRWDYRLGPPESLNFQRSVRRYYRMVTAVDQQVGRMMQALRDSGRLDNTIVIFTSDHGMYLGERGLAGKWLGHDTSIRIPFVVRDPRLPQEERGQERDAMTLLIDVKPTLLEWAGVEPHESVQGRSIASIISGETPADWRTEFFYEHHDFGHVIPRSEGVRTERHKYLRYLDSDPLFEELYDLEADPREANNLAGDPGHAELLERMRAKWQQWQEDVK